jgi:bifunctional ADP-heptose synthase (sugar kinase/adenylyltransferase)
MRIRPDILIESSSHDEQDIEKARKVMGKINGSVIVLPYFPGQSSTKIKKEISLIFKDKNIKQ